MEGNTLNDNVERAKVRIRLEEVPADLLNQPYNSPIELPRPHIHRRHYEQFTLPLVRRSDESKSTQPYWFGSETKKNIGRSGGIKGRTKPPMP